MLRWNLIGAAAALLLAVPIQGSRLRRLQGTYKLTLHNHHNTQYTASIDIGGQQIPAMFDTGSSGLVVIQSTRCTQCDPITPPYDHDASKTYQLHGSMVRITYGAGPCDAVKGYEAVAIGPMSSAHQEFWEVTSHTVGYWGFATFSAIVGLGPTGGIHDQTLLMGFNINVFSICLQSNADGYLTWGPIASNLQPNDYHTVPSIGQKHWSARLGNIRLSSQNATGSSPVEFCTDGPCAVVIDSGHSLIELPIDVLMKLSDHLPIKADCSNLHELPTIRFDLNGHPFELPPQAYVVRVTGAEGEKDGVWNILPTGGPRPFVPNTCHAAFTRGSTTSEHGPVFVFGMPFFRHYHTTFDQGKKEMRFAAAGPGCEPKPLGPGGKPSLLAHTSRDFSPTVVDFGSLVLPQLSGDALLEL